MKQQHTIQYEAPVIKMAAFNCSSQHEL
jgi:hypothetical protein